MSAIEVPVTWNAWEHTSWGDRFEITNWETGRIAGWLPRGIGLRPLCVGDRIRFRLQSGMTGERTVLSVDYQRDPPDMFFATLDGGRYVDDAEEREEAARLEASE